jgi:signal transduction histidine kinase/ActR/RegA family two-component response regulator
MGSLDAADPDAAPPRPRRRWGVAVFGLLIAACVIAGLATLAAGNAEHWAVHTIIVRERAAMLVGAVMASETAERGYLLTGQDGYRTDYEAARTRIPDLLAQLVTLTTDNPNQQKHLAALSSDIAARLGLLDRAMALERSGRGDAALAQMRLGQGRRLTGRISARIDTFSAEEQGLFDQRSGWANVQRLGSLAAILFSVFTAMALAVAVARTARRYRRALEANNMALAREIAERERTEGQLRQAQKVEALGRLTGGVAHDFNNMLAIIIGNLDLALKRVDDERPRRLVTNALDGANRAAALTQRLLAFSRQQPLEPRPVDLNRAVIDTSNLLHRVLGETITIETVLGAGAWRALVDPSQLESAILNLAINARDAMPDGGKLTLETSNAYLDQAYADEHEEVEPGQYVMMAITDTGTGMTTETLTKAFDPFFTTKPVGSGTGLGLSQVYGFIKQSGGHVKLYSEVGVGTTVKLYLRRSLALGDVPTEAATVAKREVTGLSVLVVEDAAQVREFAVEALEHLGYQVHQADGAEAALALLKEGVSVDLLLTDVVMPGLNGRKLAEEAMRLRGGLRVLYMTGYTRNAIVHNGVLDTGTHLLTKPFTVNQLDRALRDAFDIEP